MGDDEPLAAPDREKEAEVAARSRRGSQERRLMQAGGPGCLLPAFLLVAALLAVAVVVAT